MSVSDYYNAYWSDTGAGFHGRASTELQRTLTRYLGPASDCLDVGCGDGRTASRFLSAAARSCVGVDVSARAVQAARAHGVDARVVEDASSLPFPDGSFDLVTCIEVFEHLFSPEEAAAEILRVMRPGGHAFVQVPNVAHWRHRFDLAVRGNFIPLGDQLSLKEPWRDPHIRFFTARTLPRMLRKVGFEVTAVAGSTNGVLADLPGLKRYAKPGDAGPVSRSLARRYPGTWGARLQCIARKPIG